MDKAVCLSTYSTTKSSGCGILARTITGWFSESRTNQPMNLAQQIGGQQAMANIMFPGERTPQRHVEAYQQVPEPQPAHR